MKTIKQIRKISLLFVMLIFNLSSKAAVSDSLIQEVIKQLYVKVNKDSSSYVELTKKLKAMSDTLNAQSQTTCEVCMNKKMSNMHWIITLMPILLSFVAIWYFMDKLKSKSFNFAEALSGRGMEKVEKADGSTSNEAKPIASTSRLMAFITGITAIIIALCLTCYYGYHQIAECTNKLEFEGLWKILLGLGIGIIPYGINIWGGNSKETGNTIS
jgi:hypothetical protein